MPRVEQVIITEQELLDEVVGRVRDAMRRYDTRAQRHGIAPQAVRHITVFEELDAYDLRALLAAYQSVRQENAGLRDGSIVDRLREEVRALIPENRALREENARMRDDLQGFALAG